MHSLLYLATRLPKKWDMDILYIYMDLASNEILSTYGSPFTIINYMWKRTVLYEIDTGDAYSNSGDYLINLCKQQDYPACNYKIDKIVKSKTSKLSDYDKDELAFLFLISHASLHPNLIFGFIKSNEKFKLVDLLKTTNVTYPNFTTDSIISSTCIGKVKKFRPI